MVQFMDYMSRNMMKRGERRVLVLFDEFQNLSKLENALTVATVLGGYGIPCWFFVQSLRSIDNVYTREGRQTLVNSARAQIFLGAQDPEDQRYVSRLLGERKPAARRSCLDARRGFRDLYEPHEPGNPPTILEAAC